MSVIKLGYFNSMFILCFEILHYNYRIKYVKVISGTKSKIDLRMIEISYVPHGRLFPQGRLRRTIRGNFLSTRNDINPIVDY